MNSVFRSSLIATALFLGLNLGFNSAASAQDNVAKATSTGAPFELPITQGHHMYDGSFYVSNIGEDYSAAGISLSNQYFFFDHFSAGGAIAIDWRNDGISNSDDSELTLSIAPIATFYFLQTGSWAPFVSQQVGYNDDGYWNGATSLGARYFFNEHVAFSPRFRVAYADGNKARNDILGGFSLFY